MVEVAQITKATGEIRMFDWLRRRFQRKKNTVIISLSEEDELDVTIEGDVGDRLIAESLRRDKERIKRLKDRGYVV